MAPSATFIFFEIGLIARQLSYIEGICRHRKTGDVGVDALGKITLVLIEQHLLVAELVDEIGFLRCRRTADHRHLFFPLVARAAGRVAVAREDGACKYGNGCRCEQSFSVLHLGFLLCTDEKIREFD